MRILITLLLIHLVNAQEHLVFTSAIFRHGMRAPENPLNGVQYDKEAFPYGLGELTENGIRRSFELGRFLSLRYVDNVFLSQHMDNSEFYFQSVDVNRCLMTAEAVAQGMFSPSGRVVPMPVPIHTRPISSDWMLALDWRKCDTLQREFHKHCFFPEIRRLTTYRKYEAATFDCMGAKGTFFNDTASFSMIESLLAHELAGAPLPSWYTPTLRAEAKAVSAKTHRFQLGMGEYHNPAILRVTTGQLLDTIMKEILHKWNCQSNREDPLCEKILPLKFKAISTQDFILNALLESLGMRREALGKSLNPQYSSLLLIELWNVKGQPMIKILYKRGAHTNKLVNLSGNTRNCRGVIACPLEQFAACCDDYRTVSPMEECIRERPFPTPPPLSGPQEPVAPIQVDGLPPLEQTQQLPPQQPLAPAPEQILMGTLEGSLPVASQFPQDQQALLHQQGMQPLMPQGLLVQPIVSPSNNIPLGNDLDIRRYLQFYARQQR